VKILDVGKAGQTQADEEGPNGEKDCAREGLLPQAEDGEDGHNLSM